MAVRSVAAMPIGAVRAVTVGVPKLAAVDDVDGRRGLLFDDDLAGVAVGCGLASGGHCQLGGEAAIWAVLESFPLPMIVSHHFEHDGEGGDGAFGGDRLRERHIGLIAGALASTGIALSKPTVIVPTGHPLLPRFLRHGGPFTCAVGGDPFTDGF